MSEGNKLARTPTARLIVGADILQQDGLGIGADGDPVDTGLILEPAAGVLAFYEFEVTATVGADNVQIHTSKWRGLIGFTTAAGDPSQRKATFSPGNDLLGNPTPAPAFSEGTIGSGGEVSLIFDNQSGQANGWWRAELTIWEQQVAPTGMF